MVIKIEHLRMVGIDEGTILRVIEIAEQREIEKKRAAGRARAEKHREKHASKPTGARQR